MPPPQVLVWDAGSSGSADLPTHAPETALLLITSNTPYPPLLPEVSGLFSKDETPEALGVAIRQVARREQYLSPSLALALLETHPAKLSLSPIDLIHLTEREQAILTVLAEGLSNKAIAARLYLSVRTVEGHLANLYQRLGVHSRSEAILIAVQAGFNSAPK
jgi:DNA-binding NarL/FixJ family response regulator